MTMQHKLWMFTKSSTYFINRVLTKCTGTCKHMLNINPLCTCVQQIYQAASHRMAWAHGEMKAKGIKDIPAGFFKKNKKQYKMILNVTALTFAKHANESYICVSPPKQSHWNICAEGFHLFRSFLGGWLYSFSTPGSVGYGSTTMASFCH